MQLFTFGHPCEHQLRRVCIGGTSCPLNGYPDHWCCSFIKGRINFKRDKPCEGHRCRWGFAHPPSSSFDAVTNVLHEARACAAKMEESYGGSNSLHGGPYTITSTHVADVAHCALNFLRVPTARVATRIGGLLAFAAIKAADVKVFTQLLKTVKKPVDDYLIGAFEFIQASSKSTGKQSMSGGKDATLLEDLRHDLISIMASALSHQMVLVARPEQLPLQSYYIAALRSATRNKKKNLEALETALNLYPAAATELVYPESFTKSARRESGDANHSEGGKTPEHRPHRSDKAPHAHAPESSSLPQNATAHQALPNHPKASKAVTPTLPSVLEAAPKLPSSSEQQAQTGANTKQKQAQLQHQQQPTLIAVCQSAASNEDDLINLSEFPASCCDVKLPASLGQLFGGLFSLDTQAPAATAIEPPEGGSFGVTRPTPHSATLGSALRDAHSDQDWRNGPFFQDTNICADAASRQADVAAAAAAMSIVDFVLEG